MPSLVMTAGMFNISKQCLCNVADLDVMCCCLLCFAAGESQACAAAAKERIEVLEQEAESTAAEHQQAADAAEAALKAAQEAAAQQLQEAQEAAAGQLQQASEQREAEVSKVQAELAAVKVSMDGSSTTAISRVG